MNNKIIAVIIIAIVVLGGGYLLMKHKKAGEQVASDNQNAQSQANISTETSSIQKLIAAGSSRKCTYSSDKAEGSTKGTIYVADGKMRGDVTAVAKTGETTTHILNDGTTSYMWSDDGTFAFKMAFNPKDAAAVSSTTNQRAIDLKQDLDLSCESWTADASMFALPSGIDFKTFPNMPSADTSVGTQPSANSSVDSKASAQMICNSLSGTAKDQCLKSIK